MDKYFVILLNHFIFYGKNGIPLSRLSREVLSECKSQRGKISKEQVIEKGYNIYEKRNIKISEIIEELIEKDFIEVNPNYRKSYANAQEDGYKITPKGIDYLKSVYSNNYCNEYKSYEQQVLDIFKNRGELPLKELIIMRAFYNGDTIENLTDTENTVRESVAAYQQYTFDKLNIKYSDGDYIFNFRPALFVPSDLISAKVSCLIEGIEPSIDYKIGQPFPNKRYFVPYVKVKEDKFLEPFYIIKQKEQFPRKMNIKVFWTIEDSSLPGGNLTLVHHFDLAFAFGDVGNLFSTHQYVSNTALKQFQLVSCFPDESGELYPFYGEREYTTSSENGKIIIKEIATLDSMNTRDQNCFWADDNFNKWCD